MFFEYRKYIYGVVVAIAILATFFIGRATISTVDTQEQNVTAEVPQHDKVNQPLEVKGKDGSVLKYEIQDLNIIDNKLTFAFKINGSESKNVSVAKVMVKDEKNQILEENPIENQVEDEVNNDQYSNKYSNNKIRYEVDLTGKEIKEAQIVVYAISGEVQSMDDINLEETPFNKSVINIGLLKQEMINKLSN